MPIHPQLSLGTSRAAARRDVLSFLPDMKLPNGPTVGLVFHVFKTVGKEVKRRPSLVSFRFRLMATTGVRTAALSLGALAGGPRVVHATAISLFRTAGACARAARHRLPSTPFLAVGRVDPGAAGRARPERSERRRDDVLF